MVRMSALFCGLFLCLTVLSALQMPRCGSSTRGKKGRRWQADCARQRR